MVLLYWLFVILCLGVFGIDQAYAQTVIEVPDIQPCFLTTNASEYLHIWENCGADEDYLSFALMPWEWITGGYFSMIIVTILVIITYMKYQNVLYPMFIGIAFLPVAYALFPDVFLQYAIALFTVGVASSLIYLIIKQTKEY